MPGGSPRPPDDPAAAQTAAAPTTAAPTLATPTTATATLAEPSTAWHLYGGLGFGAADGKYGDVLQKPFQLDLRIARQNASGKWRFGMGLQFGSMDPADDPNIPPKRKSSGSLPTRSGPASKRRST